jgi:16S rRNA U516 pseudouridylate synthase RsuA-like enzyme
VHRDDDLPEDVRGGDMDPGQWSFISIGEGRHHEVRRLYGAISHPVLRLIRADNADRHRRPSLKWKEQRRPTRSGGARLRFP